MATQPAIADYPLRFEIQYPEGGNRFLILVRWLLAIPHVIVLGLLGIVAGVLSLIAWFAILFTGRYPEGMFRFVVGVLRWNANINAYILFHDAYPPFSMAAGAYPPMLYEIEAQDTYSRGLIFVKWLLVIPHLIVLYFLQIIGLFVGLAMVVAVLFTGVYPRGMFDFLVGIGRWSARANAYVYLLTDQYPPFSMR